MHRTTPDIERFPAPPSAPPALLPVGAPQWRPGDASDAAVSEQLLAERVIVVSGELDDAAAHRLISRLLLLDAIDRSDISLHVTGSGGTAPAALAVRDVLAHVRSDVATWAIGIVSGAMQVLLTAGTRGKRHALPHARIQLRRPSLGAPGALGGAGRLQDELRAELTALTAADAGRPVADLSTDLDAGRWLTAEEARAYGLVDRVGRDTG
ncbi:ATP-dependent Clp protease, protease subunit [Pseudonocardia thermophila]|jgi:Protease subunit of ATP-dependent Clp proteases|uniref:ATP-dependent Clp protease proteolytic subunit n=1 Tax=Pseudonocardia thermophila TaxID=1848 RepID=A0A1M6QAU2_PSETH|nr:ATP-dependent Clp protease proteolytic subunit [Pseudonocardia thermophila]SHK17301.1 ATP-dependent Clp protease, protease subunit [Pseudonocardia thermophila]